MKILQISYSDHRGGASKACYRMHKALLERGIQSQMLVALKPDPLSENVIFYPKNIFSQLFRKFLKVSGLLMFRIFQKSNNPDLHTFDYFSYVSANDINKMDIDLVHLHWVNFSMFSIEELTKIKKPIVWTFHDMWAFLGAEHCDNIHNPGRYINGYFENDKNIKGFDLNKFIWKLKLKYWKNFDFKIVTPSTWMSHCVKESYLFKNREVHVIPNIIDETIFVKVDKNTLRKEMGYPLNKKIILFGAFNVEGFNKGGDLLNDAIKKLNRLDTEIIIFGSSHGPQFGNFKTHYVGYIKDEKILSKYYNLANVTIVPSRIENFPNTVLESINCETPVVAFNIGGIPDMIEHKQNGYLAKAFNSEDLRDGINWVLDNPENIDFQKKCTEIVESKFKSENSLNKLIQLYKKILS